MSQASLKSGLTLRRQPFLYLAAALTVGILADRWIEPGGWILLSFVFATAAASCVAVLTKQTHAATLAVLAAFVASGALLSLVERRQNADSRLGRLHESKLIRPEDPVELTGLLIAPPEPAPGAHYLDVEAESVRVRDEVFVASGRARLIIRHNEDTERREFERLALDYGSRVRILVRLERARGFGNPGSPNFNEFLERRGCDLKGVIKSPLLIEHSGDARRNEALAILYRLRLKLMDAIDRRFEPRIAGTLKAMLTGNRYFLDSETVERLRESSTFHTLVIAGLHIGIIAWALLGGRSALRRRKLLRIVVCLIVLWGYAAMVGLAPPVTRATAMITIGLIGPLLFRQSASINTVALAAFGMLAVKPALVADPGFQLSFVAVTGIVGLALPLAERLRQIGEWRPGSHTPHPPSCSRAVRYFAEALFWDERGFSEEMKRSPIRYRLNKAAAARWLGRLRIQGLLRAVVLLIVTSAAIQLATLPMMALYFNRVSPVGVLLNVGAGLLTGVLMLAGLGAIAVGGLSSWVAAQLVHVVSGAQYLLVNSIVPFIDIPFATFRVAHYEGWHAIIYALYFAPLAMLVVLIDRWRPVDRVLANNESAGERESRNQLRSNRPVSLRVAVSTSGWRRLAPPLLCALALSSALVAVIHPAPRPTNGRVTVHLLDVGQGDSALIVFPSGKTMLVDGGGEIRFDHRRKGNARDALQTEDSAPDFRDENRFELRARDNGAEAAQTEDAASDFGNSTFSIGEAVVSRFIWSLGRTRVDYVLATHADADHIGGLWDVVRNMHVGQAIVGHVPTADPEYDRFSRAAAKNRVPVYTIRAGERFDIDGVGIEVLWPPPQIGSVVTSENNDSVVLRIVYASVSMLLVGDIERPAEEALVKSGMELQADVLKVPHHGSKTSSTEAFIDAVNPRYAVISVGERSRFGHPHPSVVSRYLARGVKVLQTGRDGMVTVVTDGAGLDITTYGK